MNRYYTRKNAPHQEANVSDTKWCGRVTFGHANFCFFRFMNFAFKKYWDIHDILIDYFLIDILTELTFDNIIEFKDAADKVPYNNGDLFSAEQVFNKKCSDSYDSIYDLKNNNTFFRLQWRKQYTAFNGNQPTVYKILLCD